MSADYVGNITWERECPYVDRRCVVAGFQSGRFEPLIEYRLIDIP